MLVTQVKAPTKKTGSIRKVELGTVMLSDGGSNHISNRQLSLFKQETAMASNSNFFAHTFLTKAFSSLMVFPMVLTIIFSLVKKV